MTREKAAPETGQPLFFIGCVVVRHGYLPTDSPERRARHGYLPKGSPDCRAGHGYLPKGSPTSRTRHGYLTTGSPVVPTAWLFTHGVGK